MATDCHSKIDKLLIDALQRGLPVLARPFQALAEIVGEIDENSVIERGAALKEAGYIRRIGGFFDSRRLGYQGTLIALEAADNEIAKIAAFVNQYTGVTHNYERDAEYRLWFTLLYQSDEEKNKIISAIKNSGGVQKLLDLPSEKTYKIKVELPLTKSMAVLDGLTTMHPPAALRAASPLERGARGEVSALNLDNLDKKLINYLSKDLPIAARPFAVIAEKLSDENKAVMEAEIIERINNYLESGVLRRLGIIIAHTKAGFTANGLCAFAAVPEKIDEIGAEMAKEPLVSHCYSRRADLSNGWPYNLYAMLHGHSRDAVEKMARQLAEKFALDDYRVMFSLKEWKKAPLTYFGK